MSKPKTREGLNKEELLEWLNIWVVRWSQMSREEQQAYNQIKSLIQNQPEPGGLKPGEYMHEWLEEDAVQLDLPAEEIVGALARDNKLLKDKLDSQPEIDINEVIDCVLKNSYVESEKTSDGVREYYDNQLFPEKGCEEKVRKLIQENGMRFKK